MTLYTSGFGSVIGWPIMAHGLDHTITGLRSLCSGQHSTSATQQLLEKTGMSPNMAANTDALLGFTGSTYGSHIVNSALRSALPNFRFPANYTPTILESDQILFGQRTVSSFFSSDNEIFKYRGWSLSNVVKGLRNGTINPNEIPVEIVVRNGNKIALNNRSLLVLRRAGMKPKTIIDKTGIKKSEYVLTKHLRNNHPSDTIRVRGGEPGASFMGIDF